MIASANVTLDFLANLILIMKNIVNKIDNVYIGPVSLFDLMLTLMIANVVVRILVPSTKGKGDEK